MAQTAARASIATNRLKHRVTICTSRDVVVSSRGEFALERIAAWDTWAAIDPTRGALYSREGFAVREQREQPSHRVTVRARRDMLISSAAWVYETRRLSPPRWYKVLDQKDVSEDGLVWEFMCRLVERGDGVAAPREPSQVPGDGGLATPLPSGVKL